MPRHVIRDFVKCLSFNGTDARVTVASSATIQGLSQTTLHLWFKAIRGSSFRKMFYKGGVFDIGMDDNGSIFVELNDVANLGNINSVRYDDGNWHLLTVTYNGATVAAYIDGVSIKTASATGNLATNSNTLYIANNGGTEWYKGLMDDLKLYSTGFTSTQVSNYYRGLYNPTDNLNLHLKFDEGTGTSATDSSGKSNTGTLSNATYSDDVFMKARQNV
jgi:hypothetical protein